MGVADSFPLEPDYVIRRTQAANVIYHTAEDGSKKYILQSPARRLFDLVFTSRLKTEWDSLLTFRDSMLTSFFTYYDKTLDRKFSVYFDGEPGYQEVRAGRNTLTVQLIEAVDVAMQSYPTFSNPFGSIAVADALDLGASGKMFVYPGYGYRVNGTFTSVFLDGVDSFGTNPNVPVGLKIHRVRVVGGSPTSLDYLI